MSLYLTNNDCKGCLQLEPETLIAISQMDTCSEEQAKIYDTLIKNIKISQGLCLQTLSLYQRFNTLYIGAAHEKSVIFINWVPKSWSRTEIGTVRFTPNLGYGGNGSSNYFNDGYTQQDDPFSPDSKFGAYITEDFNNRVTGFRTTNGGANAAELSLSRDLGNRIYDSWGTNRHWFTTAGDGLREIERGGTYNNGGFGGNRTIRYQGIEDLFVSPATTTFRVNFGLVFFSLALNSSSYLTPLGASIEANTTGFCKFQYGGSRLINSSRLLIAIEKYLTEIGAI